MEVKARPVTFTHLCHYSSSAFCMWMLKLQAKKKSSTHNPGIDCPILRYADARDDTHDTHQHVTSADTKNDTHIIAFAVFHLCCHAGSTVFWVIGPRQSSIISLHRKCFMQRIDTRKCNSTHCKKTTRQSDNSQSQCTHHSNSTTTQTEQQKAIQKRHLIHFC